MSAIRRGIKAACVGPPVMEEDSLAVRQILRFPADFVGFAGHFPTDPILPAVVQISVGVFLAEMLHDPQFRGHLVLVAVQRAKFMRKLGPEQTITAFCRKRAGHDHAFEAALAVDEDPASSFTLVFAVKNKGQQDA